MAQLMLAKVRPQKNSQKKLRKPALVEVDNIGAFIEGMDIYDSDTADRIIGEWEKHRIQNHYDIGTESFFWRNHG